MLLARSFFWFKITIPLWLAILHSLEICFNKIQMVWNLLSYKKIPCIFRLDNTQFFVCYEIFFKLWLKWFYLEFIEYIFTYMTITFRRIYCNLSYKSKRQVLLSLKIFFKVYRHCNVFGVMSKTESFCSNLIKYNSNTFQYHLRHLRFHPLFKSPSKPKQLISFDLSRSLHIHIYPLLQDTSTVYSTYVICRMKRNFAYNIRIKVKRQSI